jgi:hypothetical protein
MNIYNNLNKEEKYLILVRKLKEGFISFIDDLLQVFPQNNNLFIQRIIAHQLPDTSLYKILNNNVNIHLINSKDEMYLKQLCFLKGYHEYLNENEILTTNLSIFELNKSDTQLTIDENINMIWEWLNIIVIIIKNIKLISQ